MQRIMKSFPRRLMMTLWLVTLLTSLLPIPAYAAVPTQSREQIVHFENEFIAFEAPESWTYEIAENGQLAIYGNANEAVIIWPVFVQQTINASQATAILGELAAATYRDIRWSKAKALSFGGWRMSGTTKSDTAVASLIWVNSEAGTALTFYLLRAPKKSFKQLNDTFTHILSSFEVKGAAQRPVAQPTSNLQFTNWRDPVEGAFTVQVPVEWRVEGGAFRQTAIDVRLVIQLKDQQNGIYVFSNDPQIPPFVEPNQILAMSGIGEGSWYSPGYGTQMFVLPYLPGVVFAEDYARQRLGLDESCTIDHRDELPALKKQLDAQSAYISGGMNTTDVGMIHFTCQKDGKANNGFVFAQTTRTSMPEVGSSWYVNLLLGYTAPTSAETEAMQVLDKVFSTFRVDAHWAALQQKTAGEVSQIVQETSDYASNLLRESYENRQASQDTLSSDWQNYMLEVTEVADPRTGQSYKVEGHSNYYWIDAGGNIASTNTPYNPDYIRFEEMVIAR